MSCNLKSMLRNKAFERLQELQTHYCINVDMGDLIYEEVKLAQNNTESIFIWRINSKLINILDSDGNGDVYFADLDLIESQINEYFKNKNLAA